MRRREIIESLHKGTIDLRYFSNQLTKPIKYRLGGLTNNELKLYILASKNTIKLCEDLLLSIPNPTTINIKV